MSYSNSDNGKLAFYALSDSKNFAVLWILTVVWVNEKGLPGKYKFFNKYILLGHV